MLLIRRPILFPTSPKTLCTYTYKWWSTMVWLGILGDVDTYIRRLMLLLRRRNYIPTSPKTLCTDTFKCWSTGVWLGTLGDVSIYLGRLKVFSSSNNSSFSIFGIWRFSLDFWAILAIWSCKSTTFPSLEDFLIFKYSISY